MTTPKHFLILLALVAAFPASASAATVSVSDGAVRYTAAAGETNDVTITARDGRLRVSDPGADVTPGAGCVAIDAHTADCAGAANALVDTGDMNDRARGGPGADEVRGGSGDDVLLDGDTTAFEHDVLDGGDGYDWGDYSSRNTSVIFDLDARTGLDDESDEVIAIESLHGSARNDTLRGTDGPNKFFGWEGRDRLFGRGGDDELQGAQGADRMYCAGGDDVAHANTRGDFVAGNCETMVWDDTDIVYSVAPYPRRLRRTNVTFDLGCPSDPAGACRGEVVLRRSLTRKVLGRGTLAPGTGVRPVRVTLTRAGRRLAARDTDRTTGVPASVNITLRTGGRTEVVAYTIRLASHN